MVMAMLAEEARTADNTEAACGVAAPGFRVMERVESACSARQPTRTAVRDTAQAATNTLTEWRVVMTLDTMHKDLVSWINDLGRGIKASPCTIWRDTGAPKIHVRL